MSTKAHQRFSNCALIEIIHLHDCLRGAIGRLGADVTHMQQLLEDDTRSNSTNQILELELKITGRFKVIWSVFKAHSSAEDEFIWPALNQKLEAQCSHPAAARPNTNNNTLTIWNKGGCQISCCRTSLEHIEQEEYEEDHEKEETMFKDFDNLLSTLHSALSNTKTKATDSKEFSILNIVNNLKKVVDHLSKHLFEHLEKEESECMPLVMKHLNNDEITNLVGEIMGQRSSNVMSQILGLAVQNLQAEEREEMVRYMKQAMVGTFFERWLSMGGWATEYNKNNKVGLNAEDQAVLNMSPEMNGRKEGGSSTLDPSSSDNSPNSNNNNNNNHSNKDPCISHKEDGSLAVVINDDESKDGLASETLVDANISKEEFEKIVRAIVANPALSNIQKNSTIQGIRMALWRGKKRKRSVSSLNSEDGNSHINNTTTGGDIAVTDSSSGHNTSNQENHPPTKISSAGRRISPPSFYFRKEENGRIALIWSSQQCGPRPASVPLFSTEELAPTYHDGAAKTVFGCPHYSRGCKLRHPTSGRLHTCRLCCEQDRERITKDEAPLDRYAVSEVLCMTCNALQPAETKCVNPECGASFAKYSCTICHLYDDRKHNIYHCPFCNVCRLGSGLGIDFRHCMRCNACVSLKDKKHVCIPQKTQGDCPICHEQLFESTQPLKGVKCGHVMHLDCYNNYTRGHNYSCPLCKKSMEDMKERFMLLDLAIRMQPMPIAYANVRSDIYCQDCLKTSNVPYHFVGCKCLQCRSYNTREIKRYMNGEGNPNNGNVTNSTS